MRIILTTSCSQLVCKIQVYSSKKMHKAIKSNLPENVGFPGQLWAKATVSNTVWAPTDGNHVHRQVCPNNSSVSCFCSVRWSVQPNNIRISRHFKVTSESNQKYYIFKSTFSKFNFFAEKATVAGLCRQFRSAGKKHIGRVRGHLGGVCQLSYVTPVEIHPEVLNPVSKSTNPSHK